MKSIALALTALLVLATKSTRLSVDEACVANMPPVVIATEPQAGETEVSAEVTQILVTFSKPMKDQSWSWSTAWKDSGAEVVGKPELTEDKRTCVLTVKLEPGRSYGYWLNSERFGNFQDTDGRKAVPYLLVFETAAD